MGEQETEKQLVSAGGQPEEPARAAGAAAAPAAPQDAAQADHTGNKAPAAQAENKWSPEEKGVALEGQPGEPRSSSGECTSGESKTEKESEQAREGSLKDSGSQAGNETDPAEKSGERDGAAPATKREDSAVTNVTDDTETAAGKAKEEKRPKLPRPEGTCPCPRCASEDTKFCYYNNYNMKQPRYFCKGCQRYWTAGGMLRNVPIGSGRRNKNGPRGSKKSDKSNMGAGSGPMPVMANPIGPPMAAPGAYAHNRHVLWDPADSGQDTSSIPMMVEPYPGMPPGYGPPGVHPMYLQRHGRPHTEHLPNGAVLGSNQSNGSSLNSTKSHLGGQDLMSSDTIGQGSSGELGGSGGGAESPPDAAVKAKARKRGMEGAPSIGVPQYMPGGPVPVAGYDRALPPHPGFPRSSGDAVVGSVPVSVPKGYKGRPDASAIPSGGEGHGQPASQDAPWMMGTHPAAAAAAAAAYQAAAGQHHQQHFWPGLSAWGHYPWGNSAAAGWAAAAAAVYHAGQAGSNCWPPGPAGWREGGGPPGGAMPSGPPTMPHGAHGMHPPNPMPSHGNYSGQMMGYPGSNGAWSGWGGAASSIGPPHPPGSSMHSAAGHAVPPHPRAHVPVHPPSHYPPGPGASGMPGKMLPPSKGVPGGGGMLGKHPRTYGPP